MSNDARNDHLGAPPRHDELTQLQETRQPQSERDTVRDLGFDSYTAPELKMASSMSGASRMQRVVALVLLVAFVFTFVITMFL